MILQRNNVFFRMSYDVCPSWNVCLRMLTLECCMSDVYTSIGMLNVRYVLECLIWNTICQVSILECLSRNVYIGMLSVWCLTWNVERQICPGMFNLECYQSGVSPGLCILKCFISHVYLSTQDFVQQTCYSTHDQWVLIKIQKISSWRLLTVSGRLQENICGRCMVLLSCLALTI